MEDKPNYKFVKGDIADRKFIFELFENEKPDVVVNFAAESHVDRSITDPEAFVRTNVIGTTTLLDACREYGIHRRGLRGSAPRQAGLILYGGDAAPYFEPIFLLEGKRRSVCACVPQDLRTACDGVQMLQQLRSVSFPGETDSAYDQPGPGG